MEHWFDFPFRSCCAAAGRWGREPDVTPGSLGYTTRSFIRAPPTGPTHQKGHAQINRNLSTNLQNRWWCGEQTVDHGVLNVNWEIWFLLTKKKPKCYWCFLCYYLRVQPHNLMISIQNKKLWISGPHHHPPTTVFDWLTEWILLFIQKRVSTVPTSL